MIKMSKQINYEKNKRIKLNEQNKNIAKQNNNKAKYKHKISLS